MIRNAAPCSCIVGGSLFAICCRFGCVYEYFFTEFYSVRSGAFSQAWRPAVIRSASAPVALWGCELLRNAIHFWPTPRQSCRTLPNFGERFSDPAEPPYPKVRLFNSCNAYHLCKYVYSGCPVPLSTPMTSVNIFAAVPANTSRPI